MLSRYFHDSLESFADALITQTVDHAAETPGAAIYDGDALGARIACFSADRGCREARAAASQWSKWVFYRLIIPATVIQLAANRRLVCDWRDISIGWHADATPCYFVVSPDRFVAGNGADPAPLIDRLLGPLVAALSDYCGLSARVFWSNAATYYDWAVGELARQRRIPAARIDAARAMLGRRKRGDGGRNPFANTYRQCGPGALDGNDAPISRCRRICCVRDLDPTWDLCADCPRVVYFDRRPLAASGG